MNTLSKVLLSGSMAVLIGGLHTTNAAAGWMDKINQVTGKINQTSQQVDQVNRAKQQVQTLSSKLPKPSAKNKGEAGSTSQSSGGFELTKTANPVKGEWGEQVTCAGPNSATCQNGMDNLVNCMHQSKGYYYRLVAANLQGRVDNDKDLTDEERTMLEEDIASLTDAVQTDTVADPDPEYPQRYLDWLSEEDQQDIQKMNSKYMNEVRKDCDERFGGMAKYSGNSR